MPLTISNPRAIIRSRVMTLNTQVPIFLCVVVLYYCYTVQCSWTCKSNYYFTSYLIWKRKVKEYKKFIRICNWWHEHKFKSQRIFTISVCHLSSFPYLIVMSFEGALGPTKTNIIGLYSLQQCINKKRRKVPTQKIQNWHFIFVYICICMYIG